MAHWQLWTSSTMSTLVLIFMSIYSSQSAGVDSVFPPAPNCTIIFREEGHFDLLHNVTEVEPNTFIVKFNSSKTKANERWKTDDGEYFANLFGDEGNLPPYARISCHSPYPTDFEFEGVGALDFFRVWKSQTKSHLSSDYNFVGPTASCKSVVEPTCRLYNTYAEVLLTPQATGKYIFYSTADKNLSTSYFIFAEAKSKPYLIGASSTRSHVLRAKRFRDADTADGTTVILPCVTSNYNVTVNLYMRFLKHAWLQVQYKSVKYDPKQGYIGTLKPGFKASDFIPGEYKCSTGDDMDPDYVIVDANPEPPVQNKTALTVSFVNKTAICSSSNNSAGSIEMNNAYSRNPTESRLLAECMLKGNSYCGDHSYHQRKTADGPLLGSESNCHPPSCVQIENVHPEGLVYCSQGSGSSTAMKEYFTGLDGVIYTDWKSAPSHALVQPIIMSPHQGDEYKLKPNGTGSFGETQVYHLQTGISYYLNCDAVGVLVNDPFTVAVKYANGSIHSTFETHKWLGAAHSMYFMPDMTEISCSDRVWTTNEIVTTSIRIVVEDYDCDPNMFKCESNGICLIGETVCDGTLDCADGSDEDESRCEEFRPMLIRADKEVTFIPHTRNDLICELAKEYPEHLRPTLEWVHNGNKITDKHRVWKDFDGHKLLLRFTDVSNADEGSYSCVARNKFGEDQYAVNLNVREGHGPTTTTNRTSNSTRRRISTPTYTSTPRKENTTVKLTHLPSVRMDDHSHSHHFHAKPPPITENFNGTPTLTAGVVILVLLIVVALIGGTFIAWTRYKRIPFGRSSYGVGLSPIGASRMQVTRGDDSEQIVPGGN